MQLPGWNPVVHLHNFLTEPEREAAMIVVLPLAQLRDPANSVLEDLADLVD